MDPNEVAAAMGLRIVGPTRHGERVDWSLRHQTETDAEWFMGIGDALLGHVAG